MYIYIYIYIYINDNQYRWRFYMAWYPPAPLTAFQVCGRPFVRSYIKKRHLFCKGLFWSTTDTIPRKAQPQNKKTQSSTKRPICLKAAARKAQAALSQKQVCTISKYCISIGRSTVGRYSTRYAIYKRHIDHYWTSFWSPSAF